MIQPGHGTVLYNKTSLHLACVARADRVDYKICTYDGSVISTGILDRGASVDGRDYFLFSKEIVLSGLVPDTDYYVSYWYADNITSETMVVFSAFIYMPKLEAQYSDYPGVLATKNDVKTNYLGNKKIEMSYCTEIPEPNPRGLFIGCEDYIVETIKADSASDWKTPVSVKIIYYWYDENQTRIKAGESE